MHALAGMAGLLALAWAGGGTALDESDRSGAALAVHVALMLAGFAGLTLAGAATAAATATAGPFFRNALRFDFAIVTSG